MPHPLPRARFPLALLSSLLLGTGCISTGAAQLPQTLGKGRGQVALELGEQTRLTRDSATGFPLGGVAARVGVSDRVDLGGRLGPSGLEAEGKVLLYSGPDAVLSLAPSIGVWGRDVQGIQLRAYNASLPLLVGLPLAGDRQLIFGPRLQTFRFIAAAGTSHGFVQVLHAGTTVGLAQPVGRPRMAWVVPQLGVLAPIATWSRIDHEAGGFTLRGRTWIVQADVGLLLGGPR